MRTDARSESRIFFPTVMSELEKEDTVVHVNIYARILKKKICLHHLELPSPSERGSSQLLQCNHPLGNTK